MHERLESGWLVVSVVGDLDIYTAGELRAGLMAAVARTAVGVGGGAGGGAGGVGPSEARNLHGLVVDLSAVSFLDSAGLGVLVGLYQRATADAVALRFAAASEQVLRLFDITGLSKVFALYPSFPAACRLASGD